VPNSRAVVLFGSYRKGDDIETSDIDIAVEVIGDAEMKIMPLGAIPQLGYRKKVPVNIHIFSRNKIDINLFANIANGIVLEGFLEVRP
jgi:predicted nucleotidyltransferase